MSWILLENKFLFCICLPAEWLMVFSGVERLTIHFQKSHHPLWLWPRLTSSLGSHYPDPLPPPGHFCLAGWYPARHQASISHGTLALPGNMKDQNRWSLIYNKLVPFSVLVWKVESCCLDLEMQEIIINSRDETSDVIFKI